MDTEIIVTETGEFEHIELYTPEPPPIIDMDFLEQTLAEVNSKSSAGDTSSLLFQSTWNWQGPLEIQKEEGPSFIHPSLRRK